MLKKLKSVLKNSLISHFTSQRLLKIGACNTQTCAHRTTALHIVQVTCSCKQNNRTPVYVSLSIFTSHLFLVFTLDFTDKSRFILFPFPYHQIFSPLSTQIFTRLVSLSVHFITFCFYLLSLLLFKGQGKTYFHKDLIGLLDDSQWTMIQFFIHMTVKIFLNYHYLPRQQSRQSRKKPNSLPFIKSWILLSEKMPEEQKKL